MAKNAITDYDTDPANNTDVGNIGTLGTNIPSNFDNSQREIMSHLAKMNAGTSPLHDTFAVADPADLTKKVRLDSGNVTAGQTRVITVPDEDIQLFVDDSNVIRNGDFGINQRSVSGTVVLSAGSYGHDGWKAGSSGCTYTFSTTENVTTLTISAGSLRQVVEGTLLDSGTYCLGWTGTAQGKIAAGSYSATGVTGTATGGTNLTIEFNTGTLSNVSLIKGTQPAVFKRRFEPFELIFNQLYYEEIDVLVSTSAWTSIVNQVFFKVRKRGTVSLSLTTDSGTGGGYSASYGVGSGRTSAFQNSANSTNSGGVLKVSSEL